MTSRPVTLVVGMGEGLGIALVRRFAAGGGHVAFVGRRETAIRSFEAGLRAEGFDVSGHAADAGDFARMGEVFSAICRDHGAPACLVYNAALIEPARFVTPSGLDEASYSGAPGWMALGAPATPEYLMDAFRTNVAGAHNAARLAAGPMLAAGAGTILLTGGVLAFEPWLEWGVTAMGKAALRQPCPVPAQGTDAGRNPRGHRAYPRNDEAGHTLRSGAGCAGILEYPLGRRTGHAGNTFQCPMAAMAEIPMPDSSLSLRGRRILVTGGASGIGAATVRTLADLGAAVAIADRNRFAIDTTLGNNRCHRGIHRRRVGRDRQHQAGERSRRCPRGA